MSDAAMMAIQFFIIIIFLQIDTTTVAGANRAHPSRIFKALIMAYNHIQPVVDFPKCNYIILIL